MKKAKNTDSQLIDCPICDETHEVAIGQRMATTIIKGEEIEYQEAYYYCDRGQTTNIAEEACEFVTATLLDGNLMNARNAYRRAHGLLTSGEIVEIRKMYGLSQVELSRLLGWGEATISRYESKAIQDAAYDNTLRMLKNNPLFALEYLNKNKDKFTDAKYKKIFAIIKQKYEMYGREYMSRQVLLGEYAAYSKKSDENGYTLLDIDKLECVISYLASKVEDLYKVKLMKMLWYIDALSFKLHDHAITGLVYRHEKMGALPIGHYQIMGLENVLFEELENPENDTIFLFTENMALPLDCLTKENYEVMDAVISKFGEYSGKKLKEYMHQETAYLKTEMHGIIPFSLAKEIRAVDEQ